MSIGALKEIDPDARAYVQQTARSALTPLLAIISAAGDVGGTAYVNDGRSAGASSGCLGIARKSTAQTFDRFDRPVGWQAVILDLDQCAVNHSDAACCAGAPTRRLSGADGLPTSAHRLSGPPDRRRCCRHRSRLIDGRFHSDPFARSRRRASRSKLGFSFSCSGSINTTPAAGSLGSAASPRCWAAATSQQPLHVA